MTPVVDALDKFPARTLVDALRRHAKSPAWLFAAADPQAVEVALRGRLPELSGGDLILRGCEVGKLRVNRDSVTALYRLTVESTDSTQREILELHGEIIPPGREERSPDCEKGPIGRGRWRCYVPELGVLLRAMPPDAALRALPVLVDPEASRALLERAIRAGSGAYADLRIQSCSPRVIRYKPGSRCTVLFELEFPADCRWQPWPNPVIAKAHHGARGRNAHEAMRALWNSTLRTAGRVTIAEPLAFLADENVELQGPVLGRLTLAELIESSFSTERPKAIDELYRYIDRAAAGLAELHMCGVSAGKIVTWKDELAGIRGKLAALNRLQPEVVGAARSLLRRLEPVAAEQPDRPGPAHGSFRPAQVLLHEGSVGFIDFDGFCQAEPALDLALFRASLKDIGVRALRRNRVGKATGGRGRGDHIAEVEQLCDVFFERYQAITSVSRTRVVLWEALNLLGLVLNCWLQAKPQRLEHRLELLSRHLETAGLDRVRA